ncbi:MAG: phosphotransferase [Acidimicrobiia bacterium]
MADEARAITPSRVTEVLRSRHPEVECAAVEVIDETNGSASRLRLGLTYAPGRSGGLPEKMFLKRNLETFSFPTEMYSNEIYFYRDASTSVDIETPLVYGLEFDEAATRFWILMEDLSLRDGVRIGICTDHTTTDEVASVLSTLARLHAPLFDSPRLATDFPWLRTPLDDPSSQFWRKIGPRLTEKHLAKGHRAGMVDQTRWPYDKLWAAFERLNEVNSAAPHAMLHGDVHAGNVYYVAGAAGGVLDWQLMVKGNVALDVTYVISTALTPEDRRTHERDLVAGYQRELTALGAVPAPTFDDLWLAYRQNILWGVMMWLITPNGVHSDLVQNTSLERGLIAGEQLDTLKSLGQ